MKLTILGATGATGTCLTSQALAAGHEVTAVVRDPARLAGPAHPRLRTVTADIMNPASIAPAIEGADAVISAVGPRGTGPTTVIQDSVHSIIAAMDKTGTRRFLQVSGLEIEACADAVVEQRQLGAQVPQRLLDRAVQLSAVRHRARSSR